MPDRKQFWSKASVSTLSLDRNTRWPIKQLGELDCDLYQSNFRLIQIRKDIARATDKDWDFVHDCIGKGYFWILGAYEISRTLDQRFCGKHHRATSPFRDIKDRIGRVRIPIAKQEPPKAFPANHSYPNSAVKQEKGLGWCVREDEIIFYVDLSDSLLNTLFSYTDPANT